MKNTQAMAVIMLLGFYFALIAASPPQSLCDRSLEDQNLPHQSDCTKYYRCVYGRKVPKECPEKMLFNPSIGNCDLYYNVECPSARSLDDDIQEEQNLKKAIETLTGKSFIKNPTTLQFKKSSVINTESSETSTLKFVYMPHEFFLNAYYKIENETKMLLYCKEGMVFSFELEICARP